MQALGTRLSAVFIPLIIVPVASAFMASAYQIVLLRQNLTNAWMWAREPRDENGQRGGVCESVRRIESYEIVGQQAAAMPATRLVYVADREGDIAALMQRAQELGESAVRRKEEECMRRARHPTATVALVRCLGAWFFWVLLMLPGVSVGMEFKIYYQPQLKLNMIIGKGQIQSGDAERFLAAAKLAGRDGEGLVPFVLASPGGNVEAAFRVVDAMDQVRVYTTVPDDARCASACASILFASGERRSVVGTGMLGFHSCYRRDGKTYTEDSLCNEIIAANAMRRGVSHAAINRFVKEYGASDMAWVGRNVACTSLRGLCRPGLLETQSGTKAALAQSLDCSALLTVPAQLICGDPDLARLDKTMAEVFNQKLKTAANKAKLRADQRAWLRNSRNACADKACLLRSYQLRVAELKRTQP